MGSNGDGHKTHTAAEYIRSLAKEFVGWCAYCGDPSEGNFSIHDTPELNGPEVWLCDKCGKDPTPTCEEIWARIAENKRLKGEL